MRPPRRIIVIRPPAPNGHLPASFAALLAERRAAERARRRQELRPAPFDREAAA